MKKLFFVFPLILLFISVKAQNVGTDKALGVSLDNYKTFSWTANIDRIPNDKVFISPTGILIYNNESARKMIKDAIVYELQSRKKTMAASNPDMYVNFMVFEQPGKLRTYNGYKTIFMGLDTVRTDENVTSTDFKAGTLLIDFIDAKTDKIIWQGFASGILDPNKIKSQAKVRQAVSSIFRDLK